MLFISIACLSIFNNALFWTSTLFAAVKIPESLSVQYLIYFCKLLHFELTYLLSVLLFSSCSDLYVSCQVFANGQPLCLPSRTSYRPFNTRWKWVKVTECWHYLGQNYQTWSNEILSKFSGKAYCTIEFWTTLESFIICLLLMSMSMQAAENLSLVHWVSGLIPLTSKIGWYEPE